MTVVLEVILSHKNHSSKKPFNSNQLFNMLPLSKLHLLSNTQEIESLPAHLPRNLLENKDLISLKSKVQDQTEELSKLM